jgi:hypothetical protein
MPQVQIYINTHLMDLAGDEQISVDYSIFDITKLGKRGGARSYEFNLPKTNRNKTVLENPEMVNNISRLPFNRMDCLVLVDGVDVLIRFCEIESVKNAYAMRMYGANSDLFADIKDLEWEDLAVDLSEYDHFWDMDTIVASRTRTEGYIYPIIDYHSDSPNGWINNDNKTFRVEGLLPCFFYNTLLTKIIEYFGYALVNKLESITADLIIAPGKPKGRNHDTRRYNARFATLGIAQAGIGVQIGIKTCTSTDGTFYIPGGIVGDQDNYAPQIAFVDNVKLNVAGTFYFTNTDVVDIIVNIYLRYTSGAQTLTDTPHITLTIPAGVNYYPILVDFQMDDIIIQRQGSGIADAPFIDFYYDSNGLVAVEEDSVITITTIEMYNEDVEIPNPSNPSTSETLKAHDQIIFDTDLVDNSYLFNYVTASTMFPNLKPIDVVRNYLQMFGVLPLVSDIHKTVTFKTFDDIANSIGNAYNWDALVDYTEEHEISFLLNQYGQHKEFKYQQDGEEIKPKGADGSIIIGDKNLRLDVEEIELDFGATNRVKRLVNLDVPVIGWFTELEIAEEKLPRVLMNKLYSSADLGGDITYSDSVEAQNNVISTNIPIPYFIEYNQPFTENLNLGFETNLLSRFYNYLSNILANSKTVNEYIRLNPAIINQLDFSRAVYLKKHESYFMINAIRAFSYTEVRSTLVELVKLNIHG